MNETAFLNLVRESFSEMMVRGQMVKNAKRCTCAKPMPGVFDDYGWSTCQKCLNMIGLADFISSQSD